MGFRQHPVGRVLLRRVCSDALLPASSAVTAAPTRQPWSEPFSQRSSLGSSGRMISQLTSSRIHSPLPTSSARTVTRACVERQARFRHAGEQCRWSRRRGLNSRPHVSFSQVFMERPQEGVAQRVQGPSASVRMGRRGIGDRCLSRGILLHRSVQDVPQDLRSVGLPRSSFDCALQGDLAEPRPLITSEAKRRDRKLLAGL